MLPLDLEDRGKGSRDGIVGAFCDIPCRAVLNLCPGTSDTNRSFLFFFFLQIKNFLIKKLRDSWEEQNKDHVGYNQGEVTQ